MDNTRLGKSSKVSKKNKSRDHEGLLNDIFRPEVIGEDLKNSLLKMFNKIKKGTKNSIFFQSGEDHNNTKTGIKA